MSTTYIVDFKNTQSDYDLYHRCVEVFDLPDYFGHNSDALLDCFWGYLKKGDKIILKNISPDSKSMKYYFQIALSALSVEKERHHCIVLVELDDGTQMDISDYMARFGGPDV